MAADRTTPAEPTLGGTTGMPYTALDLPGDHRCIEHVGTWAALKNQGIPVDQVPPGPITVTGDDGHDWRVWSDDGFFVHAKRARTPEEQEEQVDRWNARVSTDFFSQDRQQMCTRIGCEIRILGDALSTGRPMKPRNRRQLRRRLHATSTALVMLTCWQELSMREMRERLAAVGIVVPQPDYMASFDEEVQHG